jgi:glycosyltransferase involved in cell wall biosynthesis
VDDEELPGLFAGASVHLALSTHEAYGMTVAEALTAGTPCVVRDARALGDWTDVEGCVGVAEVDPETVAAAVERAAGTAVDYEATTWDEVAQAVEERYRG